MKSEPEGQQYAGVNKGRNPTGETGRRQEDSTVVGRGGGALSK